MAVDTFELPGSPGRAEFVAVGAALGLTAAGVVVPLVGILASSIVIGAAGVERSPALSVVLNKRLQFGFLLVALAYGYLRREDALAYLELRRPTLRDLAWAAAIFPMVMAGAAVAEPLLSLLGLAMEESGTSGGVGVAGRPALWPLALGLWYLVAAPAEEFLFRGVVQGRLRETFAAPATVVLAAGCFALMHAPWPLLSGGGLAAVPPLLVETFVGGLAFGVAYERTRNLVVPALAHATMWSLHVYEAMAGLVL